MSTDLLSLSLCTVKALTSVANGDINLITESPTNPTVDTPTPTVATSATTAEASQALSALKTPIKTSFQVATTKPNAINLPSTSPSKVLHVEKNRLCLVSSTIKNPTNAKPVSLLAQDLMVQQNPPTNEPTIETFPQSEPTMENLPTEIPPVTEPTMENFPGQNSPVTEPTMENFPGQNSPVTEPTIENFPGENPTETTPNPEGKVEKIQTELENVQTKYGATQRKSAPALTLFNPFGFGADAVGTKIGRGFVGFTYQPTTRLGSDDDGALSLGLAFGDARKSVGAQVSYTMASFGQYQRDFGSGGFNLKIHRQLSDDLGVAFGWLGFLNVGDDNEFENSLYIAGSKIFRLREDLNSPFSRIALTAGIGNGIFRSEKNIRKDDDMPNVFGSLAFRVFKPVSFITEWTGQDLAMGLSVSPFENFPLVITPSIRDIAGDGNGARFVLSTGIGFDL